MRRLVCVQHWVSSNLLVTSRGNVFVVRCVPGVAVVAIVRPLAMVHLELLGYGAQRVGVAV